MAALDFPASPSTNDIHTENGASWKWTGSAWTRLGDVGAQGAAGSAGAAGAQGAQGVQGAAGSAGAAGAQGHQGVQGAVGAQGAGTGTADKIYSGLTTVQASAYNVVSTVAGSGIATVQPSGMSVAGVVTATSFSGSGADLTGITAGYWGQDSVGLNTVTSVGVNTSTVNDKDLQGIGNTFNGMYISNGMMIYDNALSGNHYIGTAFNGLMAGPVTIHGTLSVDGQYVVV
tara:strand:+ start:19 stop:708 length:690 start_codon:yes stop_codon:yes gene_type:complete